MNKKDNIQLSWNIATLLLIPLCFIVDYIVDLGGNDDGGSVVFILVILCYSFIFFLRRNASSTLLTIVALYGISIIGAVIIAFSGEVMLILLLLAVLYFAMSKTMVVTQKGEEVYEKIDDEKKDRKGLGKLFATPSEQKENLNWIIDFVIFIVIGVVFLLLKDHFTERYEMIENMNSPKEKQEVTIESKSTEIVPIKKTWLITEDKQ